MQTFLIDNKILRFVIPEYKRIFERFGFSNAQFVAERFVETLAQDVPLEEKEKQVLAYLENEYTANHDDSLQNDFFPKISDLREQKNSDYLKTIMAPFIKTRFIDFGAGYGGIMKKLQNGGFTIDGWDLYGSDLVNSYEGKSLPVSDEVYDNGYCVAVLHHIEDQEIVLKELSRVIKDKLFVVETLCEKYTDSPEINNQIAFVFDYFGRICLGFEEPVPGNYHSLDGWKGLFEQTGWKVVSIELLPQDFSIIPGQYVCFELEK